MSDQVKTCELCGRGGELYRCGKCGLVVCSREGFYVSDVAAAANTPDQCELCYNESEIAFRDKQVNFYDYR